MAAAKQGKKAGKAGKAPQAQTEAVEAETQQTAQPATSPEAKAEVKAERAVQPKQNGVSRPKSGTATGRVWEIADEVSAEKGEPAPRSDVMQIGKAEGLNEATIATQYGRWRKFHGLGRAVTKAQVEEQTPEVEEDDVEDFEPLVEDDEEEIEDFGDEDLEDDEE